MTKQPAHSPVDTRDELQAEDTARFIAALTTPTYDQRAHARTSVRRPVTLYVDDVSQPLPALLRDVSVEGVGLWHDFPIKPGEITMRIPNGSDGIPFCARVELLWCQEAARSLYISGGKFLDVFVDDPLKLLE